MPTPSSVHQAIERVALLTDAYAFPEVDRDAVEQLVADAARPDTDGLLPSDEDWTPTFDLNAACASVFEVKAGKVATRFDMTTDGQALNRSQMIAHFAGMAKMYRGRVASTLRRQPPE